MANSSNPSDTLRVGDNSVRFISWNVKGVNGPVKRARVLTHLKNLKADVVFLQETHLKKSDQIRLHKAWFSHEFHSDFDTRARGVAILVSKKIQFTPTNVVSDSCGRYVIVTGSLFNIPVLLVNVYAPNWDDVNFANRLLASLPSLNTHQLVLGGDLNCVMDPILDRSSSKRVSPTKMSKSFSMFMNDNGCVDPWRFSNPSLKVFSFFSHVHSSFSRIDYFFLDRALIPYVKSVEYLPIIISDHAPLQLDISFTLNQKDRPLWRLNPLLLSDKDFCNKITKSIDSFIEINTSSTVSFSLLWETLKAVLRGEIISFTSYSNKMGRQQLQNLTESIHNLDKQYVSNPSPELLKKRENLQLEFNLLSTKKAEQLLLYSRGRSYEYGDKNSRLLAHQLKREAASRLIPEIKDNHGNLKTSPQEINKVFQTYYTKLYTSESTSSKGPMTTFLDGLDFPCLESDKIMELDRTIELEEIQAAITTMQSGKTPGPDGFTAEFYKKFKDKLSPILLGMYRESLTMGTLPPTLSQATITLLLKKDKDPSDCGSYRPISLLNVDSKIIAKVLSRRLENITPLIISEDQTGFIKDRHSFSNIRRLLNIIHTSHSALVPEAVISLDAEKAFDRIEWEYLLKVLQKFGFGDVFTSWVRLLYSSPQACVSTNSLRSPYFSLTRGTRQGCPLSPLLFAIAIEPLSIALKSSPLLQGVRRGGIEHRVSLYADDLLLYVNDPVASSPSIESILMEFGSFSGYKLNLKKSELYPINNLACQIQQSLVPFRLASSGFRYLGVNITRSLASLHTANFNPLVENMKNDLARWRNLPLSLPGKVQSIKMNVFPKFLYLFRCLPIFLPKSFFQSIDKMILNFIWAGKSPRVSKIFLQRPRDIGGLALPNFIFYYWATNTQKISFWINAPETDWCLLEAHSCYSSSLPALVYSSLPIKLSSHSTNPIVLATLRIWIQFRRHFKFQTASSLGPISKNHLFPPSVVDTTFSQWAKKGLMCFRDLYDDDHFSSFDSLCKRYDLDRSNLFRYFQVRHFVRKHFQSYPDLLCKTLWESLLDTHPTQKGLISKVYNQIITTIDTFSTIKAKWESELNANLTENWWVGALRRVNTSTSCARLGLIQFKVVHRMHFSNSRLAKMFPDHDAGCNRCDYPQADLPHMFWACPKLGQFWCYVFNILTIVLGIKLQPCPLLAIFGIPAKPILYSTKENDIIAFTTLLARRRILLAWKSPGPPSQSAWLKDVMFFLSLEKIKYTLRGCNDHFTRKWQPFISYFQDLSVLPND